MVERDAITAATYVGSCCTRKSNVSETIEITGKTSLTFASARHRAVASINQARPRRHVCSTPTFLPKLSSRICEAVPSARRKTASNGLRCQRIVEISEHALRVGVFVAAHVGPAGNGRRGWDSCGGGT